MRSRPFLPTLLNLLNQDATLNAAGGAYEGLDRYACRERLWADMDAAGLVIKSEAHTQRVPRSQRGGEVRSSAEGLRHSVVVVAAAAAIV